MSRVEGIVLIHGRGGSAASMRPLLAPLGAEHLAVAGPEAPGNSWWPTSFLAPEAQMAPWVDRGLDQIDEAIASLGLPSDKLALVGFSQGGCLALEYAARRGSGLAAVIAFSAGLVGTNDIGSPDPALYGARGKVLDYDTDLTGTGVVVTCHHEDPHIPLKRAQDSETALRSMGADVASIWHPGPGHQPMPDGLVAGRALLAA